MTEEELNKFENEDLPSALFHVMSDDIDDETGAKLEEVILVQALAANPGALKHHPLSYWVKNNMGKCYSDDVAKINAEYIKKLKEKNGDA